MKTAFNSLDVAAAIQGLQGLVGMRVNQIYDIDHKTYLLKLQKPNEKYILLIESGIRIHTTTFEWPKNNCPSGFTMKLRKHLTNKRLEKISQVGSDRIIEMQFGSDTVAYFVIVEFFQRGNIILTDYTMTIISLLTPHKESNNLRFAVHEKYPADRGRKNKLPDLSELRVLKENAKTKKENTILKTLLPILDYGSGLIEHALTCAELPKNMKFTEISEDKLELLLHHLHLCEEIFNNIKTESSKGYIIKKMVTNSENKEIETFIEFHPYLFKQYSFTLNVQYETFNAAVDEYFSRMESQNIELKAVQMEQEVLNKVEKIKQNQCSRIQDLSNKQEEDRKKAELILCNSDIVHQAIISINSAIASQMSWESIDTLVKTAKLRKDPVAHIIHSLNLQINHITLILSDIYCESDENPPIPVDIDLALSAHANAKKYFDHKKHAAQKEKKTLESQEKALNSAQRKARTALKDIKIMTSIKKIQKSYWFEKFYWFISSENYLVIGGRDQAQNELVVKRYMATGDIYVHADIHGASNIIIKNPSGQLVPIKTLNEAGTMAVCCSVGWDAKLLCSAWWVTHDQVSKTAPTGEYLQTGSFMVRGHKNYLLPAQLSLGCGFLFRVSDSSAERHKGERVVRTAEGHFGNEKGEVRSEEHEVHLECDSPVRIANEGEHQTNDENSDLLKETLELVSSSSSETDDQSENDLTGKHQNDPINNGINEQQRKIEPNNRQDELVIEQQNKNQKRRSKETIKKTEPGGEESVSSRVSANTKEMPPTLKRGQRGKLKKIKEKYKDQDEDEKTLRMALLNPAGDKKITKREKRNLKNVSKHPSVKPLNKKPQITQITQETEDINDADLKFPSDLSPLEVLTGQPHFDDELLYCIPVVAPYTTLLNYKFKLKFVPGTTKKGKAVKSAIEILSQGENASQREKDLMKNVDYQKFASNLPGKVKMSIPIASKRKKQTATKLEKN